MDGNDCPFPNPFRGQSTPLPHGGFTFLQSFSISSLRYVLEVEYFPSPAGLALPDTQISRHTFFFNSRKLTACVSSPPPTYQASLATKKQDHLPSFSPKFFILPQPSSFSPFDFSPARGHKLPIYVLVVSALSYPLTVTSPFLKSKSLTNLAMVPDFSAVRSLLCLFPSSFARKRCRVRKEPRLYTVKVRPPIFLPLSDDASPSRADVNYPLRPLYVYSLVNLP